MNKRREQPGDYRAMWRCDVCGHLAATKPQHECCPVCGEMESGLFKLVAARPVYKAFPSGERTGILLRWELKGEENGEEAEAGSGALQAESTDDGVQRPGNRARA